MRFGLAAGDCLGVAFVAQAGLKSGTYIIRQLCRMRRCCWEAGVENEEQSKGEPEWGYWLNFAPKDGEVVQQFCGVNEIVGAECPNCGRGLVRVMSLDAKDSRLNLDLERHPVVHLLYCWTCGIPFEEFAYRVNGDGSVELLRVAGRMPGVELGAAGPYRGYTGVFAARRVSLEALSAEGQEKLKARFAGEKVEDPGGLLGLHHQVGGYPVILNPQLRFCPVCEEEMPVLASICNEAAGNDPVGVPDEETFVGNCGVQMVFCFCRKCSVVSAYHSSD